MRQANPHISEVITETLEKVSFSNLSLEITRRCNLSCAHCARGESQNVEMSKEIIDGLLSQTAAIDDLLLTGGEPFLYDDLDYLLTAIKTRRIPICNMSIVTNGTVLDKEKCRLLSEFVPYITPYKTKQVPLAIQVSRDKYHNNDVDKAVDFLTRNLPILGCCVRAQQANASKRVIKRGRANFLSEAQASLPLLRGRVFTFERYFDLGSKRYIENMSYPKKCPGVALEQKNGRIAWTKGAVTIYCPVYLTARGYLLNTGSYIAEYEKEDDPWYKAADVTTGNIIEQLKKYNNSSGTEDCIYRMIHEISTANTEKR